MAVDLRLPGRAEDVHDLAAWLRGSLVTGVAGAATYLIAARQHAETGWSDAAGGAFRSRVGRGVEGAEQLGSATGEAARTLDTFAVALARTQAELREIGLQAQADGLVVENGVVLDPGQPPASPAPLAPAAAPEEVEAHAFATRARDRWDGLAAAYRRADEAAAAVERHWLQVGRTTLRNALTDLRTKWFLSAGDMVGGGAGTVVAYQAHALGREANRLRAAADVAVARATTGPASTLYRDLDEARRLGALADDAGRRAHAIGRAGDVWGLRAGGVLAAAGVVYDIATGKPADQAIVSGAVGFGASVAAGAAIGTLIPVPVLGTALGAVGGAAVGLFASGAVDAIYEHGIGDVSGAWNAGVDALADTGSAIGDLTEGAWDAIF